MTASWPSLIVALALASIHLGAGKLRLLDVTPRSIWPSAAGGVSVAYVFLHILPDLAESQVEFHRAGSSLLARLEHHVWLLSLAGLSTFYGLERMVRGARVRDRSRHAKESAQPAIFWLHIASFGLYNLVFGYLLRRRETVGPELVFFAAAIGLHFLVNDFGLQMDHRGLYDRRARWILATAILLGWGIGGAVHIHGLGIAAMFAVLSGGIVLNVLKEELPEDRQSRFWAFAIGVIACTAALLIGT